MAMFKAKREAWSEPSLTALRKSPSHTHLNVRLDPSKLWENACLLWKPPSLWYPVTADLERDVVHASHLEPQCMETLKLLFMGQVTKTHHMMACPTHSGNVLFTFQGKWVTILSFFSFFFPLKFCISRRVLNPISKCFVLIGTEPVFEAGKITIYRGGAPAVCETIRKVSVLPGP